MTLKLGLEQILTEIKYDDDNVKIDVFELLKESAKLLTGHVNLNNKFFF